MKIELLEKIETLFWQNAFAELSMEDIAKDLNMKKASLYYHFASKEEMFLKVIDHSYSKYVLFLNEIFENTDIEKIIRSLITFPFENKSLYGVISQKGYCSNIHLKDDIMKKNEEISKILIGYFGIKHGFSKEKLIVFKSVIDDISKKFCMFSCFEEKDSEKIIKEIKKIFF